MPNHLELHDFDQYLIVLTLDHHPHSPVFWCSHNSKLSPNKQAASKHIEATNKEPHNTYIPNKAIL